MKISGYLFALYILFLSLQPVLQRLDFLAMEKSEFCCTISCAPEEEGSGNNSEQGSEKEADSCNPFQCAKCCSVFTHAVISRGNILNQEFSRLFGENSDKILTKLSPGFWHPPQLV